MNKLTQFCFYTPLKIFVANVVLSCVLCLCFHYIISPYQISNGLASMGIIFIAAFFTLLYSITALLIAFNMRGSIRKNVLLSGITFFFPFILFTLAFALSNVEYGFDEIRLFVFLYSLAALYILPNIYYFIQLRKLLKNYDGYEND